MAQFEPSSFIPKQTLVPTPSMAGGVSRRRKANNFLMVFAVVLFVAMLISAAGVFGYQRFVTGTLESRKASLVEMEKTLNPELIRELVRLDTRLKKASGLLDSHVVLTPLFKAINASTLHSVRFSSFDMVRAEDNAFFVTLGGVTNTYSAVALQSDEFGKVDYFLDPIVSDFNLDKEGDVTFKVRMKIDPILTSLKSKASN